MLHGPSVSSTTEYSFELLKFDSRPVSVVEQRTARPSTGHIRFVRLPALSGGTSTDTDNAGEEEATSPVNVSLSLSESGDVWMARDEDTGFRRILCVDRTK